MSRQEVSPALSSSLQVCAHPGVGGVVARLHGAHRLIAGEDVEVVAGVALGDGKGVIALGDQQQIAIVDDVGGVGLAVRGVEPLQPEAVRRVDAVVVDLFQVGLARHVVHVVLVGRIGGPVAAGREDLHHQQAVGGERRLDDVVDLARGVAGAANLDLHVLAA